MDMQKSGFNIYERHDFDCECGRHHKMPIGEVVIASGAARKLPYYVKALELGKKGILVTDEVIFESIGREIYAYWQEQGLEIECYVLKGRIRPDEYTVGNVICNTPFDADYIVSLGGGTVTDVVRYAATRLNLECVSIPSAMTMDGFFTNMSIIIVDGLQVTYYLNYPSLILADSDIIAKAPSVMNAAGVGEVISKISAGMDWYAGKLIKDIYYCDRVEAMMGECISEGTADETIEGIVPGEKKAIENLTDALYKSAVAMAWYDSSPCGSGAEHQLNHFWIKCQDEKGVPQSMHGQEVGVGAVINTMIWEEIMDIDFERFDVEKAVEKIWDRTEWEKEIRAVYGEGAESILELQAENHSFDKAARQNEIEKIIKHHEALARRFEAMPTSEALIEKLKKVGGPWHPKQLQIDEDELVKSLYFAKETRSGRYNALWMAEALGIMEDVASKIIKKLEF